MLLHYETTDILRNILFSTAGEAKKYDDSLIVMVIQIQSKHKPSIEKSLTAFCKICKLFFKILIETVHYLN
jgi:hypothetical protein